jgi:hypothetical protein
LVRDALVEKINRLEKSSWNKPCVFFL